MLLRNGLQQRETFSITMKLNSLRIFADAERCRDPAEDGEADGVEVAWGGVEPVDRKEDALEVVLFSAGEVS